MWWRVKHPCVYILASRRNGTLYIGVTSDLPWRVSLHKQDLIDGFTKKYRVSLLVYYEMHPTMEAAIRREKQLKEWRRLWKIRLIESMNPEWIDLFDERSGESSTAPRTCPPSAERESLLRSAWVPALSRSCPVGHSRRRDDANVRRRAPFARSRLPAPWPVPAHLSHLFSTRHSGSDPAGLTPGARPDQPPI